MPCIPVSVILPPPLDSAFGVVAERVIGMRFLDSVGRRAKGFFLAVRLRKTFKTSRSAHSATLSYIFCI